MKVLRVCHTFPSFDLPSASIQQFYINKYSKYETTYLIRDQNSKLIYDLGKKTYIFKNLSLSQKIIFKNINKIFLNIKMIIFFIVYLRNDSYFVHSHSINYYPFLLFIKIFTKNKTYISLGGTDLYKLQKIKIILKSLKFFNKIFVVSQDFKKILGSYGIKNVINHDNGVDENIFYNKNLIRHKIFICIANIRYVKGLDILLESFSIFLKNNPNYKLSIVGKIYFDDYYQQLTKKINNLKISNFVNFTNSISHNEVSDLLNLSKCLILSSHSEGFPKVIIESISTGTPIIASDVGNISSISDGCGLIVKKKDILGFSNAMHKIANDEIFYNQLVTNCKNKSYLYSWKKFVKKIDDEYPNT